MRTTTKAGPLVYTDLSEFHVVPGPGGQLTMEARDRPLTSSQRIAVWFLVVIIPAVVLARAFAIGLFLGHGDSGAALAALVELVVAAVATWSLWTLRRRLGAG